MLNIQPIAAFSDNYIWLLYDESSRQAFVVDPGDAQPVFDTLESLAALAPSTRVYCAHEYTFSNLAFARAVEPDNAPLGDRIAAAEATRERDEPTVPSELALELATNPFLRCNDKGLQASLRRQ
jgi:hydroxyacylglutathione hydrolase